jgi:hypothetical protein
MMESSIATFKNGIDTAELTHVSEDQANSSIDLDDLNNAQNEGLFLISNHGAVGSNEDINISSNQKPKRTRNRKTVFWEEEYAYKGVVYRVNSSGSGLYEEVLESMLEQFEISLLNWKRVFVYRFDLHMDFFTAKNDVMTSFRKRFNQKLKRDYGFKQIGYCWVREIERSKSQHYHWVLFLDGGLIRHPSKLRKIIKAAWEDITGAYHMPVIPNPFYFVQDAQTMQEAVYRFSYLAKVRGKGYRQPQTNDFSCSRMKLTV